VYEKRGDAVMAFSDTLSWVFRGEEADAFVEKLNAKKEKRPLITGSRHPMAEVRKIVLENARKIKAEQDARKREK
jgi:hypothetical protein